jgi:uncharacterized membrane protein YeiH
MSGSGIVELLDLLGTLVFGLSGAVTSAKRGMDLFGVLVLALVTAVAGGVIRDLVIGALPAAAVTNWHSAVIAIAAGLFAFRFPLLIDRIRLPVLLFDATGLGIFAVTGTQKALEFGISPVMAAGLGMVTGIGGGMLRDILTAAMPIVLRADIYAVAAPSGAAIVAIGHELGVPAAATLLPGAALCVFLRIMAIYRGWQLPRALRSDRAPAKDKITARRPRFSRCGAPPGPPGWHPSTTGQEPPSKCISPHCRADA